MFTYNSKYLLILLSMIPICSSAPSYAAGQVRSIGIGSSNCAITSPPPVGGFAGDIAQPAGVIKSASVSLGTNPGYSKFVSERSSGWSVRWNSTTETPHLASGKAFAIAGFERLSKDNIESACLSFVKDNSQFLMTDSSQLKLVQAVKAGPCWSVSFRQVYKEIPVYGGQLTLSFTKDDRLIMFGSDVFPDITAEKTPAIDRNAAVETAVSDFSAPMESCRISDPELSIMPVKTAAGSSYNLCWKFTIEQPSENKKLQYFVDARSGNIIARWDALVYDNITGTVTGDYKPEFAGDDTLSDPMKGLKVYSYGQESILMSADLSTNPGWTTEGQWAFGIPTGGGGTSHGYADPASGHTGSNVYGVNLSGDYSSTAGGLWYLTTGATNCSGKTNVWLSFWRYLNTDYPPYAYATVQVSSDRTNWTNVWQNTTEIADSQWVLCQYDISSVAANQSTVYVRWGYQVGSNSWVYSGWNIDDIQLISFIGGINSAYTDNTGEYSVSPAGDPTKIKSILEGQYCSIIHNDSGSFFEQYPVASGSVFDWAWNSSVYGDALHLHASNVYRHVNYIHDYYKTLDPAFTGLDYAVATTVGITGYDNAYWDGNGITFGAGDNTSFTDFGMFSEVIYHEYTHGVTEKIYGIVNLPYAIEPGAMNEGWSDYFGCGQSLSGLPKVGDGGLVVGNPNGFRTLQNTYRRETDWYNEVHEDSQMFAGSLWEARSALGSAVMDPIVHFARYRHATNFEDYLTALIVEDDSRYGDGDPSNGSPHCQAIFTGFGNHGIGGIQYVWNSMAVSDPMGNSNGKLDPGETANLILTLTNGWANATNVSAILSSSDPYVSISKSTANFGNINRGATAVNSSDAFTVLIAPNCPDTHTINFTLNITAQGPYSYSRTCLIYALVASGQMAYDDGAPDTSLYYGSSGRGFAVKMTPSVYPCTFTTVRLWPVGSSAITLKIWDDDGVNGAPGTVLGSMDVSVSPNGGWVDVDVSSLSASIASGSAYIGWLEGGTSYPNSFDNDPPYYGGTVYYNGTSWNKIEADGLIGNLMVRATGSNGPLLQIDPPYEHHLINGISVSKQLTASNSTPPLENWTVIPGSIVSSYSYSVFSSILFNAVGTAKGYKADDASYSFALPFSFPYFGKSYSSVNICTNGFLDFTSTDTSYSNSMQDLVTRVRIAPFWEDLNLTNGDIYIDQSTASQVTIRWQGVRWGSSDMVNFSVVLFNDGRIRFDYGSGNANSAPTVGISAGDSANYIILPGYDNSANLGYVRSVMFTPVTQTLPTGLSLDSMSGVLSGTATVNGTYVVAIKVSDSSTPAKSTRHTFTFTVSPSTDIAISDIKLLPDSTTSTVLVYGKVVTYASASFFYVEDDNRSQGIRVVKSRHGMKVGMRVHVTGTMGTLSNRERYISATSVVQSLTSPTGSIAPLGLKQGSICGDNWRVSGTGGQPGATGYKGLNNVGLFVRLWGKMKYLTSSTFTIDDGSGKNIKCITPSGVTVNSSWKYLCVSGISSLSSSSGTYLPLLLVSDIKVIR